MSSGMTDPEGQRVLDQALFEGIFKRDLRTLGRAISYAKQELVANSAALGETGKTFLLFGDPAMRLKVPLPTMPGNPTGQVSGNRVSLSWGTSTVRMEVLWLGTMCTGARLQVGLTRW